MKVVTLTANYIACVAVILIFQAPPVLADVYKWTSADGAIHYGDVAPKSSGIHIETVGMDSIQLIPASFSDYGATLELAKSLETSRLQREKLRLEKLKLKILRTESVRNETVSEGRYYSDTILYPYRYRNMHSRHGRRNHGKKLYRDHRPARPVKPVKPVYSLVKPRK